MALEKWLYNEIDSGRDVSLWVEKIITQSESVAFAGMLSAVGKRHPELFKTSLKPVLSIWQVYNWDLQVQSNEESILMLAWSWARFGEEIFNVYRDWHAMPHRKKVIRDQVVQLILTDRYFQTFIDGLLKKWRGLLSQVQPRENLEFIIERFNLENYKLCKDEEGNIYINFDWPEYLKGNSEDTLKATEYTQKILAFPYSCRKIINNRTPLEEDELEEFWNTLHYITENFESQKPEIRYFKNAVMGGLAVLSIFHSDWLEADSKKEEWCQELLHQIFGMDDKESSFSDVPESISDTNWENFWGEMVLTVLVNEPSDKEYRRLFVDATCSYFYKTTELICKSAYHLRDKLGDDFGRILNLCKLWAGIKWTLIHCERHKLETTEPQLWMDSTSQAFVQGLLSHEPLPWSVVTGKSKEVIERSRKNKDDYYPYELMMEIPSWNFPGVDWYVIEAAYSWIPALRDAQNDAERQILIGLHRELIQIELTILKTIPYDSSGEYDGTPYEYERWIFDLIAQLIPQLSPNESPEEYWEPILDLGAEGCYWVKDFLSSWFIEGSKASASPRVFGMHWQDMITYALQSSKWSVKSPFSYRLEELYNELLGFNFGVSFIGKPEFVEQITGLIPLYEQWAKEWLQNASCASYFATFLLQPSAANLVMPGLTWLAENVDEVYSYEWETYKLDQNFLALLDHCWSKYRSDIETKPEIKTAFIKLLGSLVERQYAPALEFQDMLVRSTALI